MDNALDPVDVNAASRNVGGDDGPGVTAPEVLQRTLTLVLAPVTVNSDRRYAPCPHLLCNTIGATLGPTEHDRRSDLCHDLCGHTYAIRSFDLPEHVLRSRAIGVGSGLLVTHRIGHVALDDHVDVAIQSRRKEERLTLLRTGIEQSSDLWQEAHVGHSVCFVENHQIDIAEVDMALIDQVGHPPGTRDRYVHSCLERSDLVTETDSPVEGLDRLIPVREHPQLVTYLCGQFTGRRQHQSTRPVGLGPFDPQHCRYSKGEGLARTRWCTSTDIATFERRRNRRQLDRERRFDPSVRK